MACLMSQLSKLHLGEDCVAMHTAGSTRTSRWHARLHTCSRRDPKSDVFRSLHAVSFSEEVQVQEVHECSVSCITQVFLQAARFVLADDTVQDA